MIILFQSLTFFVFYVGFVVPYCSHISTSRSRAHSCSSTSSFILHAIKPVTQKKRAILPDFSQSSFPDPPEEGYDLVVLGSGPGGETIAIHAAKQGARVAVIEKKAAFGGPTGLSSKAVREATKRICSAIDQIGGDRRRQINSLWKRKFPILKTEAEAWQAAESRDRLKACGCDLYIGTAELLPSMEKGDTTPPSLWLLRFSVLNSP